jgi:hypothetical protein
MKTPLEGSVHSRRVRVRSRVAVLVFLGVAATTAVSGCARSPRSQSFATERHAAELANRNAQLSELIVLAVKQRPDLDESRKWELLDAGTDGSRSAGRFLAEYARASAGSAPERYYESLDARRTRLLSEHERLLRLVEELIAH